MTYVDHTWVWETPAGNRAVFTYRSESSDFNTLNACLDDDEYRLPSGLKGLGLDIGAHIGAVAVALALDNPQMRVIAVEPVPDNLRLLRVNVAANGLQDRVGIIAGAVGKGTVTIRHSFRGSESAEHHAFVGNSSLFAAPYSASYEETVYDGWSLANLATERVVFCKVDIEGAEFELFDDPAVALLQTIAGEAHNTHGTQREFRALLARTHDVTFTGPPAGPWGFRAVRKGGKQR